MEFTLESWVENMIEFCLLPDSLLTLWEDKNYYYNKLPCLRVSRAFAGGYFQFAIAIAISNTMPISTQDSLQMKYIP